MAILDADGNPIDPGLLREPQTARVGHLQREFDQHPARGLTPARLHAVMNAAETGDLVNQLELADDMEERDAHLFAELSKRRGAVTALEWSVEAPDNASPAEQKVADQVKEWLGAIDAQANGVSGGIELVLASMTDAMLKGFAPQEMVWQAQGRVLLPRLTLQPQRWFTTSPDRRSLYLRSLRTSTAAGPAGLGAVAGEPLQPFSWLMHVHPARNGYVARMSLARVLFWPYLFKNYAVRDLAEFLEIYGLPLRLGKYPAGASDEEKRRLLQAVVQIGHNAAGIIPQSMALEFQAAAAGTEVPFAAMWDRMDAAESKAILGQTLTASQGERGSQALGNVHEQVRMDIRAADVRLVEGTITRQLIHPLVALNVAGAEALRLPRLRLDTGEAEDLSQYADSLPKLAGAGLQIPVKWAQAKLRIPEPTDGEAVMRGAAPAAGPAAPAGDPAADLQRNAADPQPADAAAAARRRAALAALNALAGQTAPPEPKPDLLDRVADEALAEWRPLMAPMVEPLLAALDAAVAAGTTLEAFAAELPALLQRMDGTAMAERLARAGFVGRLAGEADLDLGGNER